MSKGFYEVIFQPEGKTALVQEGSSLLQAARVAGLRLEAPCDGLSKCGKCRLRASGSLNAPEEKELEQLGALADEGIRLACQARVFGPAQVDLLKSKEETFETVTDGQNKGGKINPLIRKLVLPPHKIGEERKTLWETLDLSHAKHISPERLPVFLRALAQEHLTERNYSEAIVRNNILLDLRYRRGKKCLGIALDIGTTSIVAELTDLESGEHLGTCSSLNPQIAFGGDVLTRISYATSQAGGAQILQSEVVKGINKLIESLCGTQKVTCGEIYEIVVAANTTMLHLLLGVNPRSLAIAPYRPVFIDQLEVSPGPLGIKIAPGGVVTLLPSASAFVGSDIVAGLLATDFHHFQKPSLFIDIGTNGEIVALKDGLLAGTSSAAGPALEGMNISHGCRAEGGAIEAVSIFDEGDVHLKTIGNATPIGLCGSGLIDLVGELVRVGVIEPSGRFSKNERIPAALAGRLVEFQGQRAFLVSEDGQVFLTQKDIRQVQLAKGAIATGIALLLKELNLSCQEVQQVLVAGAFGYHLKPASLSAIGLLPAEMRDKIIFVGNTAKEGAKNVLINRDATREVQDICQRIKIKELSFLPEFQDYFVQQLVFPV
ncbi:ASKHA domain-containing protein [Pelotomaculum isophthalicicum JI]|uniref:ASKHA domain-containing protein n=1 Tax=Pelotomaculum isophthalicicum JI TaxID=947010 RepID=A0A9X4H321_9FIRM|nr:ASKHA domain-containing protein [Pelotomaculum isophthalicicum]MDF9407698.1 ASKHA domain-containing protein [Pelotomaculum isophthalicicum JI]